jgi:hypothetical protein
MTNDVPRAIFLPPVYANDSDAIDDVYSMRCESINALLRGAGCPTFAEWLASLR